MTTKVRSEREILWRLAEQRSQMADELLWLLGRSLQCVQAGLNGQGPYDVEPHDDAEPVGRLFLRARFKAEAQVQCDPDAAEGRSIDAVVSNELFCLQDSLVLFARQCTQESAQLSQMAAKVRRGRRKVVPASSMNALVAALLGIKYSGPTTKKPVRRPGRPLRINMTDDAILRAVEAGKATGERTERRVLERLAKQALTEEGKHTAGSRVREIADNLKRCLAAFRAKQSGAKRIG
ncbi:hypothetical protein [Roseateles sp.]|uniref:hypothetical protein n=1 Tax=Roseateles sp. TaxID=1971397 RepID=UPI0032646DC7